MNKAPGNKQKIDDDIQIEKMDLKDNLNERLHLIICTSLYEALTRTRLKNSAEVNTNKGLQEAH